MEMKILTQDPKRTHVALFGALDLQGAAEIQSEFIAHVQIPETDAIIDLRGVDFIMSKGLTLLTQAAHELKEAGVNMVLLAPQPAIRELLHNTALDKLIPLAEDLDEAEKILAK